MKDLKELLDQAKLWKQAQLIREYLAAVKSPKDDWISWATKKADWLDPLNDFDDEWLMAMDKNNL